MGLVSSVTLLFKNQFSAGFRAATGDITTSQAKIAGAAKEIQNGNGMMAVARDLSVVSMQMGHFTNQLQSLTAIPGQVDSSFKDSMARVSTVLNETNAIGGDTSATMAAIKSAAEDMAGGVSKAGQLASIGTDIFSSSVYTMLSSGLSAEQGIAATEQAALLAKATGGHMSDAASALTGIYNNLGDKSAQAGEEMTRLSDIIAGTQNYFAFENLQQYTDGLKNVSGIAVSNKIPLTQLSASIGQLNSNMITGPEAGTALKSVIAQLGNASQKLGFDIARTSDGGLDLIKTFENIKSAGASGQELISAFGTEAGPAIGLLTENLADLKSGYDYVNGSAGITLQNASKMSDTLTTKQENLNNAMLVFQGRLGAGSNAVKSLGTSVQLTGVRFLNWATDLPVVGGALAGITGGAIQLSGSLAGVANFALQSSTGLLSFISLVQKGPAIMTTLSAGANLAMLNLKGVGAGLMSAGKAVIGFIPSAFTWMGTMWGVAAAHMAVYWPVYAVIAAVAALAAGAVFLIRNWDKVPEWVRGAWQTITGWFHKGFNYVKGLFTESPKWVQVALFALAPFIAVPMHVIKNWDSLKSWFLDFVGWVKDTAKELVAPFVWAGEKIGGLFKKDSGSALGSTMAEGLAGDRSLYSAASESFNRVDRLIPHSDALEGPFSRLTHAGAAIPGTMAAGVDRDRSLRSSTMGQFQSIGNIVPFPESQRAGSGSDKSLLSLLLALLKKSGGMKGPTTNHYDIKVSFDDLKDFPSLMDYLSLLKEETDRVDDADQEAV